jgi:5'-deoxynucleotidase YfbR-like HD superfamily hydrolase
MNGEQLRRMIDTGSVTRYHTNTGSLIKTQDLAQHCYGVFWLCYALVFHKPSSELLSRAMAHDAGERKTGDMPSPTKRALNAGSAMDAMETCFLVDVCGYQMGEPLSETESAVLDLADSLDGVLHCQREAMLGNKAHLRVFRNFLDYANEKVNQAVRNSLMFDLSLASELLNNAEKTYDYAVGR